MRVKIYQINSDRDTERKHFMPTENDAVDSSIYDEVFNAEIDETDLEGIFTKFNTEGHPLHRGYSLSVSDIVCLEDKAYVVEPIGFKEVGFDESKTQKPDNLMRVVYVEPGRPAYEAEVEHTLKGEQRAVKGYIEAIYLDDDDDVCLVGNEEAKLIGMKGNRIVNHGDTIIAGPFFVCGVTSDDFRGLTDEEVTKYMDKFSQPEDISQAEVEADMGFKIYPM